MASDVLRLVNDAVRDCIARQGHHPLGGTAGDGGQAKVTAAAEGVAASCLPSLPPSVGYADANVDSVYHTLLACPLLQRQRQRSPEVWVVGTADFRLCAKCEGMELIGRRLAPADGATTTHVVSFSHPRPAYTPGHSYWVRGAPTVHGHPLCEGLVTTSKKVLGAAALPPLVAAPLVDNCRACGGPGSDKVARIEADLLRGDGPSQ